MISVVLLLALSSLGGLPLALLFFKTLTIRQGLIASPPMLLVAWVLFVGVGVEVGFSIQQLWLPFWAATFFLAGLGGLLVVSRGRVTDFFVLGAPTAATFMLLMPYAIYGFADYHGSWFWDGWSYIAAGESLLAHAPSTPAVASGPFHDFGDGVAAGSRFISSALIAVFARILPLGGDSQSSVGYFLLLATFTFACSCRLLSWVIFGGNRALEISYVFLVITSGVILNVISANNFDQLLGLALSPFLAAAASISSWQPREAIALGAISSAVIYAYPELAPVNLLAPILLVLLRILREHPAISRIIAFIGITATAATVSVLPFLTRLLSFFQSQLAAGMAATRPRPGEGYFPTLMDLKCAPAAVLGLHEPFGSCWLLPLELTSLILAGFFAVFVLLGTYNARSRFLPFILSAAIGAALSLYMILARQYDYGAYKLITSSWYLVCLIGLEGARTFLSQPRLALLIFAPILIVYTGFVARSVWTFDSRVPIKDISHLRSLQAALPNPQGSPVALQIPSVIYLEWALYYLRHRNVIYAGFDHVYIPIAKKLPPSILSEQLAASKYLISDGRWDECYGHPMWSGGPYYIYKTDKGLPAILTAGFSSRMKEAYVIPETGIEISIFSASIGSLSLWANVETTGDLTESVAVLQSEVDETTALLHNGRLAIKIMVPAGRSNLRLRTLTSNPGIRISDLAICSPRPSQNE